MKGKVSPVKQSNFSAKFGNINIEGRKLRGEKRLERRNFYLVLIQIFC